MTPRSGERGVSALVRSVGVAAGPDEYELVLAFDCDQRGEDRYREARVVELDGDVIAARVRGLLPGGAEFGSAGVDAVIGSLVVVLLDRCNLCLDVERNRLD